MNAMVHARFDENGIKKINQIQSITGMNVSQILRRLVDVAEVKPLDATAILSQNASSVVNIRQDSHDTAAA